MYSIDFECYYSKTRKITLATMALWDYVFHPETAPYLVAIHSDDFHWVGDPRDFEWDRLDGQELCAHNAGFDSVVWLRCVRDGIIPKHVRPRRWICTADMVAYLRYPRALGDCGPLLLGRPVDKSVRNRACEKTPEQMKAEGWWPDMIKYGGSDAVDCFDLAKKHLKDWPACEQRASEHNRKASQYGFYVDVKAADDAITALVNYKHECEKIIPWVKEGEKPTSPLALRAWGRANGIPIPASLAKDKPEAMEFFDKYAEQYPLIEASRNWLKVNGALTKVQALRKSVREDNTAPYPSMYFGAHTGRNSSGGGKFKESDDTVNIYNMYREPIVLPDLKTRELVELLNYRGLISARPGKILLMKDWAQVEYRLTLWRVGDTRTIDIIRGGKHPYQAHAEATLGWDPARKLKDVNPQLYALAKARCLALGYRVGAATFKRQAKAKAQLDLSLDEAAANVASFRASNPLIVAYWNKHDLFLKNSAICGHETHEMQLPSGRWMAYFKPRYEQKPGKKYRDLVAELSLGGRTGHLHGGVLLENEMQATSRDKLRDSWDQVDAAGMSVLFSVYDEMITEVDDDASLEDADEFVTRVMKSSPEWAAGCPFGVDCKRGYKYVK